jgi:hypothetical protein
MMASILEVSQSRKKQQLRLNKTTGSVIIKYLNLCKQIIDLIRNNDPI